MPGKDITAVEFVQKVDEMRGRVGSSQKYHHLLQEVMRQWSFMAPSRHFFIEDPEVRHQLINALDMGVVACDLVAQNGEGKERELGIWRNDLVLDAATHRFAGKDRDELACAVQHMDDIIGKSPSELTMEKGKLSEESLMPIYARLSATALRLYGHQKIAQIDGESTSPTACLEKLVYETIDYQNQLTEVISQTGTLPEVSAIAAGSLFRMLHFSNLLVQWHHSSSPDPRLIRFGLLREHHPGKKRSPKDIFNLAELTPEGARLLRVRIKPFTSGDQTVGEVKSLYATEEIRPLQEKAERVRKLIKHAIDPTLSTEKQQEAMEGMATYLGSV